MWTDECSAQGWQAAGYPETAAPSHKTNDVSNPKFQFAKKKPAALPDAGRNWNASVNRTVGKMTA